MTPDPSGASCETAETPTAKARLRTVGLDFSLRGKCQEYAEAAVTADPTLRLVRGWYVDPTWGRQEHWWTERPDGTIHDPTSAQFPMGGVADWYEEYAGVFPCQGCGRDVAEDDPKRYDSCCTYTCYGRMVGIL